jgi:hypothetical protein
MNTSIRTPQVAAKLWSHPVTEEIALNRLYQFAGRFYGVLSWLKSRSVLAG